MDLRVEVPVEIDKVIVLGVALPVVVAKEASLAHAFSCKLVWSDLVCGRVSWGSRTVPRNLESEVHDVTTIGLGKGQDSS